MYWLFIVMTLPDDCYCITPLLTRCVWCNYQFVVVGFLVVLIGTNTLLSSTDVGLVPLRYYPNRHCLVLLQTVTDTQFPRAGSDPWLITDWRWCYYYQLFVIIVLLIELGVDGDAKPPIGDPFPRQAPAAGMLLLWWLTTVIILVGDGWTLLLPHDDIAQRFAQTDCVPHHCQFPLYPVFSHPGGDRRWYWRTTVMVGTFTLLPCSDIDFGGVVVIYWPDPNSQYSQLFTYLLLDFIIGLSQLFHGILVIGLLFPSPVYCCIIVDGPAPIVDSCYYWYSYSCLNLGQLVTVCVSQADLPAIWIDLLQQTYIVVCSLPQPTHDLFYSWFFPVVIIYSNCILCLDWVLPVHCWDQNKRRFTCLTYLRAHSQTVLWPDGEPWPDPIIRCALQTNTHDVPRLIYSWRLFCWCSPVLLCCLLPLHGDILGPYSRTLLAVPPFHDDLLPLTLAWDLVTLQTHYPGVTPLLLTVIVVVIPGFGHDWALAPHGLDSWRCLGPVVPTITTFDYLALTLPFPAIIIIGGQALFPLYYCYCMWLILPYPDGVEHTIIGSDWLGCWLVIYLLLNLDGIPFYCIAGVILLPTPFVRWGKRDPGHWLLLQGMGLTVNPGLFWYVIYDGYYYTVCITTTTMTFALLLPVTHYLVVLCWYSRQFGHSLTTLLLPDGRPPALRYLLLRSSMTLATGDVDVPSLLNGSWPPAWRQTIVLTDPPRPTFIDIGGSCVTLYLCIDGGPCFQLALTAWLFNPAPRIIRDPRPGLIDWDGLSDLPGLSVVLLLIDPIGYCCWFVDDRHWTQDILVPNCRQAKHYIGPSLTYRGRWLVPGIYRPVIAVFMTRTCWYSRWLTFISHCWPILPENPYLLLLTPTLPPDLDFGLLVNFIYCSCWTWQTWFNFVVTPFYISPCYCYYSQLYYFYSTEFCWLVVLWWTNPGVQLILLLLVNLLLIPRTLTQDPTTFNTQPQTVIVPFTVIPQWPHYPVNPDVPCYSITDYCYATPLGFDHLPFGPVFGNWYYLVGVSTFIPPLWWLIDPRHPAQTFPCWLSTPTTCPPGWTGHCAHLLMDRLGFPRLWWHGSIWSPLLIVDGIHPRPACPDCCCCYKRLLNPHPRIWDTRRWYWLFIPGDCTFARWWVCVADPRPGPGSLFCGGHFVDLLLYRHSFPGPYPSVVGWRWPTPLCSNYPLQFPVYSAPTTHPTPTVWQVTYLPPPPALQLIDLLTPRTVELHWIGIYTRPCWLLTSGMRLPPGRPWPCCLGGFVGGYWFVVAPTLPHAIAVWVIPDPNFVVVDTAWPRTDVWWWDWHITVNVVIVIPVSLFGFPVGTTWFRFILKNYRTVDCLLLPDWHYLITQTLLPDYWPSPPPLPQKKNFIYCGTAFVVIPSGIGCSDCGFPFIVTRTWTLLCDGCFPVPICLLFFPTFSVDGHCSPPEHLTLTDLRYPTPTWLLTGIRTDITHPVNGRLTPICCVVLLQLPRTTNTLLPDLLLLLVTHLLMTLTWLFDPGTCWFPVPGRTITDLADICLLPLTALVGVLVLDYWQATDLHWCCVYWRWPPPHFIDFDYPPDPSWPVVWRHLFGADWLPLPVTRLRLLLLWLLTMTHYRYYSQFAHIIVLFPLPSMRLRRDHDPMSLQFAIVIAGYCCSDLTVIDDTYQYCDTWLLLTLLTQFDYPIVYSYCVVDACRPPPGQTLFNYYLVLAGWTLFPGDCSPDWPGRDR